MSQPPQSLSLRSNRILASLPAADLDRLVPDLEPFVISYRDILHPAGAPLGYVYFILSGVVSILVGMENGDAVEFASIGREGCDGFTAFLGSETYDYQSVVQVPGQTLRMPAERFQLHADAAPSLRDAMSRYVVVMLAATAQAAACNRLHPLDERCARWLLATHDRVDSDEFPMTHEFVAHMLGVRRPSVTLALGTLQQAGLVSFRRGNLRVLDRQGLEEASCECFAIIRQRTDDAFPSSIEL